MAVEIRIASHVALSLVALLVLTSGGSSGQLRPVEASATGTESALAETLRSMRVRVGRNSADFPLSGAMTADDRMNMESEMCEAFKVLKELFGGNCHSLAEGHEDFIDQAKYDELVMPDLMLKDMAADSYLASAGIASDWPTVRGCYIFEHQQFIIWVGAEDHPLTAVDQAIVDTYKEQYPLIETTCGVTRPAAVAAMRADHGIYMAGNGRINIAGLRLDTIPAFVAGLSPHLPSA